MNKLNRSIIKKAGCNVLDCAPLTIEEHKKDLTKRLKRQEKALEKTIVKGWEGQETIECSIVNINHTLVVISQL